MKLSDIFRIDTNQLLGVRSLEDDADDSKLQGRQESATIP